MDHWEQYVDPHHEIEERSWWEEIQGMNRFDMWLLCMIELYWAIVQGRNVYSLKSWNIRVDLWNCCAFPDFVKISYFLKRSLCNYVDNKVTSEFCWEGRLKKKKYEIWFKYPYFLQVFEWGEEAWEWKNVWKVDTLEPFCVFYGYLLWINIF